MPEQIAITHTAREVRASSSGLSSGGGVAMAGLLIGPRTVRGVRGRAYNARR